MTHPVYVLNGPNLNLLGQREVALYGRTTLEEIRVRCEHLAGELGMGCNFRQTNHEGVMVDWIQEAFAQDASVVINPAGFSFGCVPVLDALKLLRRAPIEVHITNIHRRPAPYHRSLVSEVAQGVICGLGATGYLLALRAVADALEPSA